MAVTSVIYNKFKEKQNDGNAIDFENDTIKVALIDDNYSPNIDTDEFFSTPDGDEVAGAGYDAGGKTLANVAVTLDTGNDLAKIDADDAEWDPVTVTNARFAVIYKDTGTPATSRLIAYVNFGENKSITSGVLTITWNASGIMTIT